MRGKVLCVDIKNNVYKSVYQALNYKEKGFKILKCRYLIMDINHIPSNMGPLYSKALKGPGIDNFLNSIHRDFIRLTQ